MIKVPALTVQLKEPVNGVEYIRFDQTEDKGKVIGLMLDYICDEDEEILDQFILDQFVGSYPELENIYTAYAIKYLILLLADKRLQPQDELKVHQYLEKDLHLEREMI